MNIVCLTGRMARNANVTNLQSGVEVAHFTLMSDRPYRDSQGNTPADAIDCELFGTGGINGRPVNNNGVDNFARYATKGVPVSLQGTLRPYHHQDNQGNWVDRQPVRVDEYHVFNSRNRSDNGGQRQRQTPLQKKTVTNPFAKVTPKQPKKTPAKPAPATSDPFASQRKPATTGAQAQKQMSKGKKIDISDDDLPF